MEYSRNTMDEFRRWVVEHPDFERLVQRAIAKYKLIIEGQSVAEFAGEVRIHVWQFLKRFDLALSTVVFSNAIWVARKRNKRNSRGNVKLRDRVCHTHKFDGIAETELAEHPDLLLQRIIELGNLTLKERMVIRSKLEGITEREMLQRAVIRTEWEHRVVMKSAMQKLRQAASEVNYDG